MYIAKAWSHGRRSLSSRQAAGFLAHKHDSSRDSLAFGLLYLIPPATATQSDQLFPEGCASLELGSGAPPHSPPPTHPPPTPPNPPLLSLCMCKLASGHMSLFDFFAFLKLCKLASNHNPSCERCVWTWGRGRRGWGGGHATPNPRPGPAHFCKTGVEVFSGQTSHIRKDFRKTSFHFPKVNKGDGCFLSTSVPKSFGEPRNSPVLYRPDIASTTYDFQ